MATSDHRNDAGERRSPAPPDEAVLTTLRTALDRLPSDQRAAIRFAMTERLTVSEIASRLGHSRQHVQSAMRAGITALHAELLAIDPAATNEPSSPNA